MQTLALSLLLSAAALSAAHANESRYSDLNLKTCRTLSQSDDESASVSMTCEGLEGYPIHFREGDLRQSVFFGPVDEDYAERGFESFGPFNHTAGKVEWRIGADGKPLAAILRYVIENTDLATDAPAKATQGQVLVISKVATAEGEPACVVGYVDALANPQANLLARQVADDAAADFTCGADEPAYHGKRGGRAADPMRFLPQ